MSEKKKPASSSSNRGRKRIYNPPIPWDRLEAMRIAMFDLTHSGKPLSGEMASEIGQALAIISQQFQNQIRKRGAPRNEDNWRVAMLARWLVRFHNAEEEAAINAALDTCRDERPPGDDDPIIAIYETLAGGLEDDIGDCYGPTYDVLRQALEKLPKNKNG